MDVNYLGVEISVHLFESGITPYLFACVVVGICAAQSESFQIMYNIRTCLRNVHIHLY